MSINFGLLEPPIRLKQTNSSGVGFQFARDLAAANTDSPVVKIIQDNAGDDQAALYIDQDGTGYGLIVDGGNVGMGTTGPGAKLDVNGDILLSGGQQDYKFTNAAVDSLLLQGQTSGTYSTLDIFAKDGDATDGVGYTIYGLGTPTSLTNTERLELRYSPGINAYRIITAKAGTGTQRPLVLDATGSGNYNQLYLATTGNVGIGTTGPTNILSFGGNAARTVWLERHTTANTAGNTLTVQAGGATAGATDKAGGDLLLYPGVSTGSAESGIKLYGCVAGVSGTADRTQTVTIQVLGNKLGFFTATPVVKQAHIADASDLATCISSLNSLLAAIENYGLLATS